MENSNLQTSRIHVWLRLFSIGLLTIIALIAISIVNQPVQAQISPPDPEAASDISESQSGVFGVLNFEAADLNGYINTYFDVDGSYFYLTGCSVLPARPKWNGVTVGSPVAKVHGGEHAIWFGDPATGDYGGTGGDQQLGNPCINPTHTGTLTTIPVEVPIDDKAYFTFWSWEETEMSAPPHLYQCGSPTHCQYDVRSVYISSTNEPFWSLQWNTRDSVYPTTVPEGVWHKITIDITDYMDQFIQIRFEFDTTDGRYNEYQGWYIDDITLLTLEVSYQNYLPLVRK